MAAVNYRPMEKLNLTLSGTYTDSESGMDRLQDYSALCEKLAGMGAYNYDLSTVHTYSELNIAQTDISLQASYQLDENLSLGCGFTYLEYDDDEPYLYDGTGEAYLTHFSISYFP